MLKIAVLVSGGGTNLQALIDAQNTGIIKSGKIDLVVSNKEDAYALTRAQNSGIESVVIAKDNFDSDLIRLLKDRRIDLIVLAGFMVILSEKFVSEFKNKIINVHPSLIPSFCGMGYYGLNVHKAVLEYGTKLTGATVHFVSDGADEGEIILQKSIEVLHSDTPEILQKRVMQQCEWDILPKAVELFCAGKLSIKNRTVIIKE